MASYVVTGAARGIGLEFVTQLSADSNNTVFALVRNKSTANELNNLSSNNISIIEADITDSTALQAAASEVSKATGGKLDYLINNAAYRSASGGFSLDEFPSDEALEQELMNNFKVNTVGVVHTINAFLPLLRLGSAKKVISLSSGMGDLDLTITTEHSGQGPYAISKAALNMVVAKYAVKYKAEGFVFLAISPGVVNTLVAPPTAQQIEHGKTLKMRILKVAPDFKGPITPKESVALQLDVIREWKVENTGAFVSQFGNKQWV
ncbi:hypothetical protein C8J57DRAFT_1391050 [Mycena rebaudengoi]|nr:hypothetical protein C8J57DRAFT_1391050 [Mycena rebaudengoi]